jgi:hypothetical protein
MHALRDVIYAGSVAAPLFGVVLFVAYRLPGIRSKDGPTRVLTTTCVSSLVCAIVVSPLAISALFQLWRSPDAILDVTPGKLNLGSLPPPRSASFACGVCCGYFIMDTLMLLLFPKEMHKELGGTSGYLIMWLHHVVSFLVWPYAFANGIAVWFITYFLVTEVTNIGQNLFLLADRGKIVPGAIPIGVAWAFSFAVVRVAPVPHLLYSYLKLFILQNPVQLGTMEWIVTLSTVPIPIALNLYWFYKIVKKASRMLFPKPK